MTREAFGPKLPANASSPAQDAASIHDLDNGARKPRRL